MRRFNVTGTCVKARHYMADITNKLNKIVDLIDQEQYFIINRPRQYGKTTTLSLLRQTLEQEYTVLAISFEKVGNEAYESVTSFLAMFYRIIKRELQWLKEAQLLEKIEALKEVKTFDEFDDFLTDFMMESRKEMILLIDECDDSSNNDIFLKFLGVLRSKYLRRTEGRDVTFKSVILAGVHDVRNLKYKIKGSDEENLNSPWNIAESFDVDMSFNVTEIKSLLEDYLSEHPNMEMDVAEIAQKIHYFTSGYPFLVSYLCKRIHEKYIGDDKWNFHNLEQAVNEMVLSDNTNFDSLLKNIENHEDLANLVRLLLIDGEVIPFGNSAPAMKKGLMYGVVRRSSDNKLVIHNPIYEMKIYSYLTEKIKTSHPALLRKQSSAIYTNTDGSLNMSLILEKYSQYLKDLYDDHQNKFIENNARLLFSIFIKPIINGVGFMYREPVISDRRRLDVVINYNQFKYVIELKIWYGEAYYEQAKMQLSDYLERERLEVGYMIIHDFRKEQHRRFTDEMIEVNGKEIKAYFV